jgi:glucose-6-phosphate dehydrogenase assembly protein OpcA
MTDLDRALSGEELSVDVAAIEKSLSELWRVEGAEAEGAVTKAALWNVVAHTYSDQQRAFASETLSKASASVPQRTIVIRANVADESRINAWISANCHLLGDGKQVCSEEIVVVAGGDRVAHVPPLISALLLPDLPVATWWVGDLPHEQTDYLEALLDPVDRLIVDSCQFDNVEDLRFISRCSLATNTVPFDLNWARLEEWRVATASLFDLPEVLSRRLSIKSLELRYDGVENGLFGQRSEALLFAAWLFGQLGYGITKDGKVEGASGAPALHVRATGSGDNGAIAHLGIDLGDGLSLTVERNAEAIRSEVTGIGREAVTITRTQGRSVNELVVRQLSRAGGDKLFERVLPRAIMLAGRVNE